MAKDDKNLNLFQKLTRLFRSGPVVRRKIRNLDTTVAVADKSKSSGALLFQKSMAPTYATITANAYNLSERLMRYQDFGEMEYCLHGDTKIAVPGGYKTISELAAECEGKPDHTFLVYSYDHNLQRIIPAWGKQARQTRTDHAYTVTFDNGQQIIGTPNHRLMKRDGTFCKIEDLKAGDAMMPFYRRDLFNGCKEEGDGYRWIYTMDRRSKMNGWVAEHRVIGEMLKGSTLDKNEVVHHRNFVKFDNRPENLEVMTEEAHLRLHSQTLNGVKWSERNAEWIQAFKVNHSKFMTENNPSERKDITFGRILEVAERTGFNSRKMCEVLDTDPNTIKRRLRNHGYQDFQTFVRAYNPDWHNTGWDNRGEKNPRYVKAVTFDRICSNFSKGMTNQQLAASLDTTVHVVEGRIRERGYKNYADFATSYDNLKVASVEYHGVIPLYDLTVDGYKNFATDTVISHNTPELAAALDIYADETCAQDEKGRVLHIYSDNEKIREVLEDLFYNTLNVEFNLRSWARNLPVHKDTVIPLLDGTEMTIENLAKKMKEEPGWTPWVYSIQDGTKRMVPGKVTWCDLTRKDSDLVRVWLDDGTYVDCTPDHEWILRDGSRKKAEDLDDGMSLMPFYRDVSSKVLKHRLDGYERVYDPCTESYEYTHRLVAEGAVSAPPEGKWHVVHHVNFDKRNNDPSNLRKMTWADHSQLHLKSSEVLKRPDVAAKRMAGIDRWLRSDKHRSIAKEHLKKLQDTGLMKKSWAEYNESEKHKEDNTVRSEASKKMWNDRRDELKEKLSIKFDDKCIDKVVNALRHQGKYLSPVKLGEILIHDAEFMSHFSSINEGTNRDLTKPFKSHAGFEGLLNKAGASTYISLVKERLPEIAATPWFKRAVKKSEKMSGIIPKMREKHSSAQSQIYMNHKVDRIERLSEKSDVYCMEVMGPSGEHDRHNFMVLTRFATGEVNLSGGICSQNCKYGDMFLYNDVSPEHGVINAFPIPVNEIEREENYDPNDPMAVRYRWVTLGNRTLENWEVTHFRLLGNDMFLPYGSSIIEPARRIWRQLILIEDAMLVYRVVRAPERRVFYIDVANIPPENVPMYVEEQRKNLRSSQVIDRNTGRVDLRYNPLCISLKTLIKLQDGREISLSDLITEWESGKKDQWVYSIDPVTNRYAPGKVVWAGVTRRDADLVRVWLDDDTFREVTPDHRFMMRDGTYRKAEELLAGDSLMPLYTKLSSKEDGDSIIGYEKVYDPGRNQYVFTHRQNANSALAEQKERIREELDWKVNSGLAIHHVNFNRRDNRPNNLVWMGKEDHFKFHASLGRENLIKWNKSEKKKTIVSLTNKRRNSVAAMSSYNGSDLYKSHNEARKRGRSSAWRDEDKRRSAQANMRLVFDNECMKILTDKIKSLKEFIGMSAMCDLLKNDVIFLETYARANAGKNKRNTNKSFHKAWLRDSLAKQDREYIDLFVELNPAACAGSNFKRALSSNRNASQYLNHKVIRVERVLHKEDTGCITVEKYHNFAAGPTVDQLGEEKTCNSWILLHNSVDEDYFIPVRGGESGTKIDTLAGGQNAAAVEDVAYIQKKLFAALKIPRAYLGYDESLSSKATLAQEDIRFSRTINVIQKTLISELNKLAIIHLYANGYDHEDLQNFTLRLSNPSTIAQQQKLELWRTKFEIAGSAPEGQMSKEFIRKEIWGLNDEQCAEIDEQRLKEKIVDATIESAEPEVEPGGGAEDVFAGGEEEASAEEEVPGDEGGEEELFAGDDVFDKEPDVSLLTASDDPTDDEDFPAKVSLDGVKVPVKAKSQLDRVLYNRGRIRHSGAAATHRPDFAKMTSHDNKSLTDPYDTESISSFLRNPFGEGVRRHKTPVGEEVLSSLRNMSRSARFSRTRSDGFGDHRRIISESDDEVDVGDAREHREVLVIDDDGSDDK